MTQTNAKLLMRPTVLLVSLACTLGIAQAAGNGPPPFEVNVTNTVDANVVNTVDTNVVGTVEATVSNTVNSHVVNVVPFDSLTGVAFTTEVGVPGTVVVGLPPGKVHALDLSLGPASSAGDYCTAEADLRLFESGSVTSSKGIGALVARGGPSAIAHDYSTPIELLFDETATSASLTIELDGQVSGAGGCLISIGLVYEQT